MPRLDNVEQYRIDTDRAIDLYVQYPTRARILDALQTLDAWPRMVWATHVGVVMALVDVARERHGVSAGGLRAWIGHWLTRKSMPKTRITWNDYWFCRWILTQNTEGAGAALAEIHRRGWHLDHQADPKWLAVEHDARGLIQRQGGQSPDFRAAMIAEIQASPCGWHGLLGMPPKHERARL